jgi:hypothetical protein
MKASPFLIILLGLVAPLSVICGQVASVRLIGLPEGYIPIGVVYDGGCLWTVSYAYGAISRVNLTSGEVRHWYIEGEPDTNYDWQFYGLAKDDKGDFWIAARVGKLVRFTPSTGMFRVALEPGGEFSGVLYANRSIYFATWIDGLLYRYDPETGNYETWPVAPPRMDSFLGFSYDGRNVWFSGVITGNVYRFDGSSVRAYPGFHRPLGTACIDGLVYIAENVRWSDVEELGLPWRPAIAVLNPATGEITRYEVSGSPYAVIAWKRLGVTIVAWSSSGEDRNHTRGIGLLGGNFTDIDVPAVYYLAYNPVTLDTAYFTYYGSGSGLGECRLAVERPPPSVGGAIVSDNGPLPIPMILALLAACALITLAVGRRR